MAEIKKEQVKIIPSLASADPLNLMKEIDRVGHFPNLHLDIEDGSVVPNITFGIQTVRRAAEYVGDRQELDAHLFVARPMDWIQDLADCGIKRLAIQAETLDYPLKALNLIRRSGMKAGLGLNFSTPAEAILPFLPLLDYVIVMTAEPDGMGMCFYPEMLKKIERLSMFLAKGQEIWADGGIDDRRIPLVGKAGAAAVIMGRAVFHVRE